MQAEHQAMSVAAKSKVKRMLRMETTLGQWRHPPGENAVVKFWD